MSMPTDQLKERMRKRDYVHKVAIRSGLSADWDTYKILRNEVNSNICSAKEKYYKTKLNKNKNNPKGIWKIIKKILPRKNKNPANTKKINAQICSIPAVIANKFNDYFGTIAVKLCCSLLPNRQIPPKPSYNCFFQFKHIEINYILKRLEQLKNNKAVGIDNIPGRLLKMASEQIAPSLIYICNLSLETGTFPQEWKLAKVIPLF